MGHKIYSNITCPKRKCSKMVGALSFSLPYLCIQTPIISNKNSFLYFSQFSHPYSTLTCSQNHPYKPHSSISQQFSPPYFRVKPSQQTSPKIFSLRHPCSQFRLPQGTRELGSIVRTNTNLISPFFLKVWTMISGLTTTNSLYPAVSEKWCIAGSSL